MGKAAPTEERISEVARQDTGQSVGNCLNRDNPLNPPYQGDRILGFTGLRNRG